MSYLLALKHVFLSCAWAKKRKLRSISILLALGAVLVAMSSSPHAALLRGNFSGTVISSSDYDAYDGTTAFGGTPYYGEVSDSLVGQAVTGTLTIDTSQAPTTTGSGDSAMWSGSGQSNVWMTATARVAGFDLNFGPYPEPLQETRNLSIWKWDDNSPYNDGDTMRITVEGDHIQYISADTGLWRAPQDLGKAKLELAVWDSNTNFINDPGVLNEYIDADFTGNLAHQNTSTISIDREIYEISADFSDLYHVYADKFHIGFNLERFILGQEHAVALSETEQVLLPEDSSGKGGLAVSLNDAGAPGGGGDLFTASYTETPTSDVDLSQYIFDGFDFMLPGENMQLWDLDYTGTLDLGEVVDLVFSFDPSSMALEELDALDIFHFADGAWVAMGGIVDLANGTITVSADSFSPFVLGTTGGGSMIATAPEPTTLALMGLGLAGIGWKRRKVA